MSARPPARWEKSWRSAEGAVDLLGDLGHARVEAGRDLSRQATGRSASPPCVSGPSTSRRSSSSCVSESSKAKRWISRTPGAEDPLELARSRSSGRRRPRAPARRPDAAGTRPSTCLTISRASSRRTASFSSAFVAWSAKADESSTLRSKYRTPSATKSSPAAIARAKKLRIRRVLALMLWRRAAWDNFWSWSAPSHGSTRSWAPGTPWPSRWSSCRAPGSSPPAPSASTPFTSTPTPGISGSWSGSRSG